MDEHNLLNLKHQSDSQDAELNDLTEYIKDLEKDRAYEFLRIRPARASAVVSSDSPDESIDA
jgi:hypothetical protein